MTIFLKAPRSFNWPARAGAVLLALVAAGAPAGASAPMPLSTAIRSHAGFTPVLFKYEDLFGRSPARPKSYRQVDLDRDQVLSREELQQAFGSRWRAVLTSLDRNTDGSVTIDEVQSSGSSWSDERKAREEKRSGSGAAAGAAGQGQQAGDGPGNSGNAGRGGEGAGNRGGNDAGSRGNSGGNDPGSRGNAGGNDPGSRGNGGGNSSGSGGSRGRN